MSISNIGAFWGAATTIILSAEILMLFFLPFSWQAALALSITFVIISLFILGLITKKYL